MNRRKNSRVRLWLPELSVTALPRRRTYAQVACARLLTGKFSATLLAKLEAPKSAGYSLTGVTC